jgi:DNA helicase-2/ATP-dependent DNA helicase PcrA
VRCLSARTRSITVVGDEDQSIYKWRGADIRNILDFERDHPGAGVVKLERNYRSTGNILRAANAIIEKNSERRPKRLYTESGDGERIVLFEGETERDEADFVTGRIQGGLAEGLSPRDVAVFYRTNAQSRVLEDAMRARDIPYVVVGGTRFFDRTEIKDLVCYLRAIGNPDDGLALQRIVNVPARGIGATTVERIGALMYERRISAWDALTLAAGESTEEDRDDPNDVAEVILGPAPRKKVAAFVALMEKLRADAVGLAPADLAEKVLEESGYRDALAAEASLEAEGRSENLMEFIAQMREYEREAEEPTLYGFLERIALQSDVDGYDPEKGAVSLMTVHTAKGLEFPWVFLTGLEERIFPHARSVDDDSAVEEERRLCYVAVTRARTHLFLSRVRRRRLSGQELPGIPSRFLRELPMDDVDAIIMERPAMYTADTRGRGPWGGQWSKPEPEPTFQLRGNTTYAAPKQKLAASPTGELSVHYDESDSDGPGLQVGAKLRHPSFGVGEIRGWQGSGADLKVTMRFGGAGVKTILARFLSKP